MIARHAAPLTTRDRVAIVAAFSTPGSFGERAQGRSARLGSCFFPVRESDYDAPKLILREAIP